MHKINEIIKEKINYKIIKKGKNVIKYKII